MAEAFPPKSFVSRLRSGRLEEWQLHRCDEPADLCPLRTSKKLDRTAQETRLRCLDVRTEDAAMEWLSACVTHSDDMVTLRDVLQEEALMLSRIGNHQVIERVAAMVARRELCVVVSAPIVHPALISRPSQRAAPATGKTPSQYQPRIEEPPPIDIGDFPNVPAAVLVEAARTATPFCEH